jgi:hypothetical protein
VVRRILIASGTLVLAVIAAGTWASIPDMSRVELRLELVGGKRYR